MSSPSLPIPDQAVFLGGDDDATMSSLQQSPPDHNSSSYHHHPLVELGLWSLPSTYTTLPNHFTHILSSTSLFTLPSSSPVSGQPYPPMALPWSEPPSGGWLCPSLRRPPDLLTLPTSQPVAEPPSSQPDPLFRAIDKSILATGPAVLNPTSRSEWLYALARTLATARDGICSVMLKHGDESFDSLTDQELDYVGSFAKCAHALDSFTGTLHSDPDELLFCGACLTHTNMQVTESNWMSILHQCGGDVSVARDTLIAQHTSSITDEIHEWDAFQRHALKDAIITSITSLSPPTQFSDLGVDPRLENWFIQARSSLMDDASIRAHADADAHHDIVFADLCAKADAEAASQAKAYFD